MYIVTKITEWPPRMELIPNFVELNELSGLWVWDYSQRGPAENLVSGNHR